MSAARQTTLRDQVTLDGVGVHSGSRASVTLNPAEAGCGLRFLRTDVDHAPLSANVASVTSTALSTVLGDPSRGGVATIEHVMAALAGMGVDNCVIEVDGPEIPIMDGSSRPFVDAIDRIGVVPLSRPRRALRIKKPVMVETDKGCVSFHPYSDGFRLEVEIDFAEPVIGRQSIGCDVTPAYFRRELARARTFGFMEDVARLWEANLARGASLDNTIVVNKGRVLNAGGLRFADEFVRHKALDAVGDLALAGGPILGMVKSYRGGHALNVAALKALLADRTAYDWVEPKIRRERGHAEVGAPAAMFGPDVG